MTKRSDGTRTGRRVFACRVDVATPAAVEALAQELGCLRVNNDGELVMPVPAGNAGGGCYVSGDDGATWRWEEREWLDEQPRFTYEWMNYERDDD